MALGFRVWGALGFRIVEVLGFRGVGLWFLFF